MAAYRFYLFGAPRLEYLDQPVAIDTRKALALLAYLLIEKQPQSRDTLAALLWPESDQTSARAALRRTLSPLRNALSENLVDFGRETLAVHPEAGLWCDVIAFQERLTDCETHGHGYDQVCPRCLVALQEAVDLYTGDFLAGFSLRDSAGFDDWQFFEADRLRREFSGVLERLVMIQKEQGNLQTAIENARRWLSLDPLNEAAHRALIGLYAQSGQRNAALRQYRECVRILDEELGVSPLEETTQLYETVKENRLGKPAGKEQFSQDRTIQVISQSPPVVDRGSSIPALTPLIGRASEWENLTRIYAGLRQNGVFVALTGEPGIGKTRLADEFVNDLQKKGSVILSSRGYAGESNLAYAPLIDLLRQGVCQSEGQDWWQGLHPYWLAEVALLVPELSSRIPDLPPVPPAEGPGAQTRFYEGVCQILTALVHGPSPGVIFIDNLEWADESTLDLLAYLVRRLEERPFLLLVTWQTGNTSGIASLEQMLNEAERRDYGFHLPLSALQPDESFALIEQLDSGGQPFSSAFKQQLVEASQGLPYFLVEYMQAALEGEIRTDMAAAQWPVPTGLRCMLQDRLAYLSGPAFQILQAAAVIGRTFEIDLLQTASGRTEEEIIQGIEELLARNLIRELSVQSVPDRAMARYDFRQDQVRALVLEEISLVRRRLLHRRIAEALAERSRLPSRPPQSGQIAYHYQQAGSSEQAADYYFQAGQMARSIHANADALNHFQAALALGFPQKSTVLIEIGDLLTLNGDYLEAIQQYEAAAAFSAADSLPAIEQKIGRVYLRRGLWEQAACHFEAALYDLEALPIEQQNAFEAKVRADWSLACHREGKTEEAGNLAQAALNLAESSEESLALAQVHNLLGILARTEGNFDLALQHLTESLTYARQPGHPGAQIAALNNLALAQADQDKYGQAVSTLEEALAQCRTLGDRHLEAALCNNLADVLRASGQVEASIVQLKQAVTIFAEIGQNVDDWEPEIWKLVEW